ncbi:MAG: alpha/beta hydrolase [Burkholderiales bacterium]|nr:alpha/beta hydrolase [Burkholderiales bacterium]
MNRLRNAIGRRMLFPALRLAREQMKLISDPLHLRELAARADAMGRPATGVRETPVTAGSAPATWLDVKGARRDRVLLYLHGGAFVTETPVFHGALLARLCTEVHARGLMLHYRLAPEHRYPAALDDCIAAYRWLLDTGHTAEQIVVAGDSAGGNLTLALLLRARDEGLPLPAGAVALSPVTDFTFSGGSVQRNDGIDDMFVADKMGDLLPVYLDDPRLRTHPHVSPVFGDYTGMPPLLLLVGSTELLLDDSVRVAHRWPGAQLEVWHGMPHVFPGFDVLPEAIAATQGIGRFARECLKAAPSAQGADVGTTAGQAAAPGADMHAPGHPPARAPTAPAASLAARTYLGLAVANAALALGLLLLGLAPLMLANPLLWATSAVVLACLLVEAPAVGRSGLGLSLAALLLGPGTALSVFLYLRARKRGAG